MTFSLCGPRRSSPTLAQLTDASNRADPTKTSQIRAKMRREGDGRWMLLARTLREALTKNDILGMRGIGQIPHSDKTEGFTAWLHAELQQKVFGFNGAWVRPYIRSAAEIARRHAHSYTPAGSFDASRVTQMETMAVNELRGIVGTAEQQISRAITNAMMRNASPTIAANAVSGIVLAMRRRTVAMSEYMIARTHAATTLDIFRNAGVQRVGTIPEGRRRRA